VVDRKSLRGCFEAVSLEAFEGGIVDLMMHDKWVLAGRSRHTADIHPGILWGRFTFHFGHSQTENESQHFRFEGTRSKGWISATSVHETLRLAPLAGAVQYRTFY